MANKSLYLLSYSTIEYVSRFLHYNPNIKIICTRNNENIRYIDEKDEHIILNRIRIDDNSILIRWGSRAYTNQGDNVITYNLSKRISSASDKKHSRLLLEKNNIPVPMTMLNIEDINLMDYPVIIRPLHHQKAKKFYFANNSAEFVNILNEKFDGDFDLCYASSFFNKTNEYRVYCASGKVLYVQEKLGAGKLRLKDIEKVNEIKWGTINWHNLKEEPFRSLCLTSLKATKIHKLDFSAVDIMYNRENNEIEICEVNTCPELLDYGFHRFSEYFNMLLEKNDHYAYEIDEENYLWENNFKTT